MAWYWVVLLVLAGLFLLTLVVYFFNLDMKLASGLQPLMNWVYDRRKRDRRL